MAKLKEINVEYIGGDFSSRSIHELKGGVSYYNYEGTHFRVFSSFNDAKAFLRGEPVEVIAEFDSEEDLDRFLDEHEPVSLEVFNANVNIETLKDLLTQADAISIDDSPMLTSWKSSDREILIDTRWAEDELEYECSIYNVEKILFGSDSSFQIYHDENRATRIKLFSIKLITV